MKTMICRYCNVDCVYSQPKMKKGMILNHDFYYSYRFNCPNCKRWYYPEEARVYYKDEAKNIVSKGADRIIEMLKAVEQEFVDKSPLKRGRQLLWRFHMYFLDNPQEFHNQEAKLAGLRFLAEVKINAVKTRQERRDEFDVKKQTANWRLHIIDEKCFVCFKKSQLRHHMIQLQNGGRNSYKNIVNLCNLCHAEIHPWLKK